MESKYCEPDELRVYPHHHQNTSVFAYLTLLWCDSSNIPRSEMLSPAVSLPSIPAPIADDASVRVVGSVETPQQNIPAGSDGIVVAALADGIAYEVQFRPPVSAVETVSQDVLAIA
jgi:hypothetical protein